MSNHYPVFPVGSVGHNLMLLRGTWHDHIELYNLDGTPLDDDSGAGSGSPGPGPFPYRGDRHSGRRVRGGPVELYLEILVESGIIEHRDIKGIHRSVCECKTKHALVPAHSQELWASALEDTP